MSSRTRLILFGLGLTAVVAAMWAVAALRPTDEPGNVVEVSGALPRIEGPVLSGNTPAEPGWYRGKVVVVNFWASWCGPCRREQPGLQSLWDEYGPGGDVAFLGVNFLDDPAAAREYLREYGVTYPSVTDDGPLSDAFGVPYLPATVIADRTGEMRYRLLGAQPEQRVRQHIEELLNA